MSALYPLLCLLALSGLLFPSNLVSQVEVDELYIDLDVHDVKISDAVGHSVLELPGGELIVTAVAGNYSSSVLMRLNWSGDVQWIAEITDHDSSLFPSLPEPHYHAFISPILPSDMVDGAIRFIGLSTPRFVRYGLVYLRFYSVDGEVLDTIGGFRDSVLSVTPNARLAKIRSGGFVAADIIEPGGISDSCDWALSFLTDSGRIRSLDSSGFIRFSPDVYFFDDQICAPQSVAELPDDGYVIWHTVFPRQNLQVRMGRPMMAVFDRAESNVLNVAPSLHGDSSGYGGEILLHSSGQIFASYMYSSFPEDSLRADLVLMSTDQAGAVRWSVVDSGGQVQHDVVGLFEHQNRNVIVCGSLKSFGKIDSSGQPSVVNQWYVASFSPNGELIDVYRSASLGDDSRISGAALTDAGDLYIAGRVGEKVYVARVRNYALSVDEEREDQIFLDLSANRDSNDQP